MPLLNWNPDLSVNVKIFDEQHQILISLINKLYEAMKEGKGDKVSGDIFSELIAYTQTHFAAEEELFRKYGYPEKDSHIGEHRKLTQQVLELQEKYKSGGLFITVEVLNFLKDWLTKHIMLTDKKYGSFFRERGISE